MLLTEDHHIHRFDIMKRNDVDEEPQNLFPLFIPSSIDIDYSKFDESVSSLLSTHSSIHSSTHSSIQPSSIHPPFHSSIHPFIHSHIHPSTHPTIQPSSIQPSNHHQFNHPTIHQSIHLSIHSSNHPSIHQSICLLSISSRFVIIVIFSLPANGPRSVIVFKLSCFPVGAWWEFQKLSRRAQECRSP